MKVTKADIRLPTQDVEVVLGAGGIKGLGHIGLLKCLEEKHVSIGMITGASAGSLMATFYANGYSAAQMEEIFTDEDFRYPSWELWAQCLHFNDPWNWPKRLMQGGLPGMLDFGPWLRHIVEKYKLKPQNNLRIVSTDFFTRRPVVFEGTDYDLASALQASCAVVTGLYMQPLFLPSGSPHQHAGKEPCDAPFGHYLIDGFYYHPEPADLCASPAIVSKVGFATRPPSERLPIGDLILHWREMSMSHSLSSAYPDRPGHLIVPVGMPDVASLTFGISQKKLKQLVDHGYCEAARLLNDQNAEVWLRARGCCAVDAPCATQPSTCKRANPPSQATEASASSKELS